MRAAEWLSSIRDAALQIRSEEQIIEYLASKLGPHGQGSQIASGSYLDPMRQVDEYLDAQQDSARTIAECNRLLDQSWPIVRGIARLRSDADAEMVARRYFWGESWGDVAEGMGLDDGGCQYACGLICRWLDVVGIARVMEEGRADE